MGSIDDYRTEIIIYSAATPGHTYIVPDEVGTVWLFDSKAGQEIPCYKYTDVAVDGTAQAPRRQEDPASGSPRVGGGRGHGFGRAPRGERPYDG